MKKFFKGPRENPTWCSIPMSEVLNKQFKVIHSTWQEWLNAKAARNPWGPRFTYQWSENRGILRRSQNSDLGSLARAPSNHSDYGSGRIVE